MTRADIFIQTLSEFSGKPRREIADLVAIIREHRPGGTWDQIVPDDQVEELIVYIWQQAPGVMSYLVRRASGFVRNTGHV